MKKSNYSTKKIGIMAVFISVGMVLQYVESQIILTPVPGGKLGLCNTVSIINIFMFGGKNTLVISLLRAFLGTLLTGGVTALPYSLVGAFLSTLGMWLIQRFFYPKVSMIGMSVAGAALHNFSQVLVASVIFGSVYIFSYLPILLCVSAVSGTVTGVCAQVFGNRVIKEGDFKL